MGSHKVIINALEYCLGAATKKSGSGSGGVENVHERKAAWSGSLVFEKAEAVRSSQPHGFSPNGGTLRGRATFRPIVTQG
jgi:hypothetical protein